MKHFEFLGGALCLDYANTLHYAGSSDPGDDLAGFEDFVDWAEQRGIIKRQAALALKAHPHPAFLAFAKKVRANLYSIFSTLAAGQNVPVTAMTSFNSVLRKATPVLQIKRAKGIFLWEWRKPADDPYYVLWNIVGSAGKLLTSADASRVRECAGPRCTWLFLDKSKNGTRRWCDMKNCGNREKSRRHYARIRRPGK